MEPVPAAADKATAADPVATANIHNRQTPDAQSVASDRQEQRQHTTVSDEQQQQQQQQQSASSAENNSSTTVDTAAAAAAAAADETALQNQKLVEEFQYLLEKSQSLFTGLRDLPPTGSHRQWRPYFEKTFEVYTKLWKFQQTHRPVLEDKNNYGLKRWEVGEIASKIGQLYYHYYLRTSDTSYLHEAYVFYDAIHERQYFKDILEVKNPALMIKKMRYYARFIVVSLLMNKDDNIRILISELEGLVDEYTRSFKPPDAKEWHVVLDEINTFMEAEKKLAPVSADRTPVTAVHRLAIPFSSIHGDNKPIGSGGRQLRLQEAILVGNCASQIKFSELTLDMYRILLSLELQFSIQQETTPVMAKEESTTTSKSNASSGATAAAPPPPAAAPPPAKSASSAAGGGGDTTAIPVPQRQRPNPHKYLLYRPSLSQLLVYLSTAFKDATDHGVVLLYLSADGCEFPHLKENGYNAGGVTMSQRKTASGSACTSSTSNIPAPEQAPASPTTAVSTTTHSPTALGSSTTGGGVTGAATTAMPAVKYGPPIPASSVNVLYPADLIPYTRKPLFLIVDSTHSTVFGQLSSVFEQPLMCLMSPTEYPSSVQDRSEIGSLFTLFLHTPLLGFCSVSDIGNLDQEKWNECVDLISKMEGKIGDILLEDPYVDVHVKRFMSDEFLWAFIVRFTLCSVILRWHTSFKEDKMFPTCMPALPETIYRSPDIIAMLHELTLTAEVSTYFHLPIEEPAS